VPAFPRSPAQFDDLARWGITGQKSIRERRAGLDLEARGDYRLAENRRAFAQSGTKGSLVAMTDNLLREALERAAPGLILVAGNRWPAVGPRRCRFFRHGPVRHRSRGGAAVPGASFAACSLRDADLATGNFAAANSTGTDLTGASLTKADLDYARLDGANLPTANLMRTSLIEASLVGACFDKADLSGANLSAADLTAASLAGAVLRSTHLVGARPPGADGTGNQHRHRQPDRRCSPRNWFLSACGLAVPAAE
jgi:hypothetical protein